MIWLLVLLLLIAAFGIGTVLEWVAWSFLIVAVLVVVAVVLAVRALRPPRA